MENWACSQLFGCVTSAPFSDYTSSYSSVKGFSLYLFRLAQLLIDVDGEELLMSRYQAYRDAEVLGEIQA